MADTIRYVQVGAAGPGDGSSGDPYPSLADAIANEGPTTIGAGDRLIIRCRRGTGHDTNTEVHITSSWTVTDRGGLVIEPDTGNEHNGQFDTGYVLSFAGSYGSALRLSTANILVRGIEIRSLFGTNPRVFECDNGACDFDNVMLHHEGQSAYTMQHWGVARNCLLYVNNSQAGLVGFRNLNWVQARFINCLVDGADIGFQANEQGSIVAHNCVSIGATTDYDAQGTLSGVTCASDKGSATYPWVTVLNVADSDFVDRPNQDYHLAPGSALEDEATDYSSDPSDAFDFDFEDDTRVAPWDTGPDETAGGPPTFETGGTATGAATVSGVPEMTLPALETSGQSTGAASVSGTPDTLVYETTGAAPGEATVTGAATVGTTFSGLSSGEATTTGTAEAEFVLLGQAFGAAASQGTPHLGVLTSGQAAGVATLTAAAGAFGAASGAASADGTTAITLPTGGISAASSMGVGYPATEGLVFEITHIDPPRRVDHHALRWLANVVDWCYRMAAWRLEDDPMPQYLQRETHLDDPDPHPQYLLEDTHLNDPNPHPQYLLEDTHLNDPDPHTQYLLEDTALQIFAWTGYGGLDISAPVAGASLGGSWEIFEYFTDIVPETPRGITLTLSPDTFSFDNPGVYKWTCMGTFEHNSSNQGRLTYLRFYNITKGAPTPSFTIGTGRNAEATPVTLGSLVEIDTGQNIEPGDVLRVEVGGGDSYSSVQWDAMSLVFNNVGEWRGTL